MKIHSVVLCKVASRQIDRQSNAEHYITSLAEVKMVIKSRICVCAVHAINRHGTRHGARTPDPADTVESGQRGEEQAGRWWKEVFEEVAQEQVVVGQLIGRISHCRTYHVAEN